MRDGSWLLGIGPSAAVLLATVMLLLPWAIRADFYQDLELPNGEDSTDSEIKKSYRILSKQNHPDLNPSEEARQKYLKISRAYEVLSDPKKRKIYDMKGEDGLKQLEDSAKGQRFTDPFAALFGGGGGDRTKGQDVQMSLKISLADAYNGNMHTITLKKQKLCRACKGSGARSKEDVVDCPVCKGKGVVIQKVQLAPGFIQQLQNHCGACDGTGKKIKRRCSVCGGRKVAAGESTLEVLIEKGVPEGHEMKFEMEADESPDVLPGDVILKVHTAGHPVFKRSGNDLHMSLRISLLEALVGFSRAVMHMDDHEVLVKRSSVTPHGTQMTIRDEGMPKHNVPSERGNLVITFEVEFPRAITEEQAAAFKTLLASA
eukprot:RCo035774